MSDELNRLIDQFANGSVTERYEALRHLIAQRKHHAAARDERFEAGINDLLRVAGDPSVSDINRLLSIAILGRLASTIKRLRNEIYESLHAPFSEELPEPSLLSEPDDRSYIGNACAQVQPQWGVTYCASAAINEETGEQSRIAFLKALLSMQTDLCSTIKTLEAPAYNLVFTTEDPGASAARRLKRLMSALKTTLVETSIEPGEEPGRELAQLCKAIFKGVAPPKKEEPLYDLHFAQLEHDFMNYVESAL